MHSNAIKLNSIGIQHDFKLLEACYSKIQTKVDYLKKFITKVEAEDDSYEQTYTIATKGMTF